MSFKLIAEPLWVNLLVLVPPFAYFRWRRRGVAVARQQLLTSGVFAAAFGFVEAVVVVYLRAAVGLLPGYQGTLSDVIRRSGEFYQQSQAITQFPQSLLTLEVFREAATLVMLLTVDLRRLGHYLLRGALGHRALAAVAAGSRRLVSHSAAMDFTGVVSALGQRPRDSRGSVRTRESAKE